VVDSDDISDENEMTNGQIFLFIRTPRAISPATVNNNIKSSVSARDGHGLGPSMGWVGLG